MRNAPRATAVRLALGMLWLALVLTAVNAVVIFVYAHLVPVQNAQTAWTPVFSSVLVVAVSLLGSIWALRRGHLLLTTGLTLVSAGLAAIMTFMVSFGAGMITADSGTIIPSNWVDIISAVAAACFVLCVLTVITCVVALVRQRLHPIP